MRKYLKIFIIYLPVILVSGQVLANLMSFVWPEGYADSAFYLNHFLGCNMLFAIFLVAFTHWFRFCAVSRYAAWAELAFGIFFMIVHEDNIYNIMFQIIVGTAALLLTFRHFVKQFPLCSVALVWDFFKSVTKKRSCSKGLELWENKTYHKISARHESRA